MIIPFTYNLLKKHPALMVMIHRVDETYEATSGKMNRTYPYIHALSVITRVRSVRCLGAKSDTDERH